jgi:hypothetical protein
MRPFRNEDYESWLRITLEIHTTASKLKKGWIFTTGVKCNMETLDRATTRIQIWFK